MFTKRKFLGLSQEQQHKKCAELLLRYYESEEIQLLQHYNDIQTWLSLNPLEKGDKRSVSDRFHCHLTLANQRLKEHRLLPQIKKEDRTEGEKPWPIAIYLDNIRSAYNVGSIIRTCEAFALGTLYFSKDTPDPSHKQVQKTAMGCEKWVENKRCEQLEHLPKPLIALETSSEAIDLHQFLFPDIFTLAIGNEEYGLSEEVLASVDYLVAIPMRGRKNSLNVANAFAIAAAEIQRQASFRRE